MIFVGDSIVSAGACGSYNGENALVTCGHISATVGSSFQLGYAYDMGSVTTIQYADGQAGDFSVISLNDVATVTHTVGDSLNGFVVIDGGTCLNPAVGTYVKKYGDSTKYSYGIVTHTNVTVRYGNISITGMTKASIYSGLGAESGDSGGPYLVGDRFCGVHSGHPTSDNTIVIFTPYSLIASAGFTVFSSHNCARWTDTGPSTHSGYCIICNETVYQGHADYWNSTINRCLRCGRTDIIVVP